MARVVQFTNGKEIEMNRQNADRMISSVPVAKIRVGERSRSLCEDVVVSLVESIKAIGLKVPISVQIDSASRGERYLLVVGLHRLEACRRLGMAHIDTRIVDLDDTERRLWEIAENLHRAELTALERSEQIAEWVKPCGERIQPAQLAPPEKAIGYKSPPPQQQRGINAAVRELGVERTDAQRSIKIAGLTPQAKSEARALGFDDNQSALLRAAKAPSKEGQIRALREEAARRAARHDDDAGGSERRLEAAMNAVRHLSQDELAAFADWFDAFRAEPGERTSGNGVDNARAEISIQPGWTMRI
jgi:ParB family chromosome partitioning protein